MRSCVAFAVVAISLVFAVRADSWDSWQSKHKHSSMARYQTSNGDNQGERSKFLADDDAPLKEHQHDIEQLEHAASRPVRHHRRHHRRHKHHHSHHKSNLGSTLCEGHDYDDVQCSLVKGGGCCEFDDGECFSAVGDGMCHEFSMQPTAVPTPAPTVPTPHPTIAPTDGTCAWLAKKASDWCHKYKGMGERCMSDCWKSIEKKIDADDYLPEKNAAEYPALFADSRRPHECRLFVEEKIHGDVCWPSDCIPVMRYFCGKFKNKVFPGSKKGKRVYVQACDVCINHYVFAAHPIHGWQCWFEHSAAGGNTNGGFCNQDVQGNNVGQKFSSMSGVYLRGGQESFDPNVPVVKEHGAKVNRKHLAKYFKKVREFMSPV